jgi:hypothetical protein
MFSRDQRMGQGRYHRNINFVGNTVKSFNGQFVFAKSIDGLNITGNTFEFSADYPTVDAKVPAIDLQYCDNVVVDKNICKGFKSPLSVRISADTENASVTDKQGFIVEK